MIEDNNKLREQLLIELHELSKENLQLLKSKLESQQEEEVLQQSERRYRDLADLLPETVVEFDKDGNFTFMNLVGLETFGYTKKDIEAGLNVLQTIDAQDHERAKEAMGQVLRGEGSNGHEYSMVRKDGSRFPAFIHGSLILHGDKVAGLRAIAVDITARKKAEELILQSERTSRATIDALSATLCVLDEEGTVLNVNRAWRKFADDNPPVPANYALGWNYLSVCDNAKGPGSEQAAPFAAGIRAIIQGEIDEFSLEYPCHSPGEERWFTGKVTRFPGGKPLRLAITHEDISDRKRIEKEINNSNEELHALFAAMTDIILVLDSEGRYVRIAPTNPLNLYLPSENLIGKRIHEVLPQRDADTMLSQIEMALKTKEVVSFQYKLDIGLREVWFDARVSPSTDNEVFWVARDITKHKRAEEALEESEEQFRLLFENMTEGVALHEVVRDEAGLVVDYRILNVNASYTQHTGIPLELAKGTLASELYKDGTPPYLKEYEEVVISGNRLFFSTYFPSLKKHFSISAVRTKPDHFATVFSDITETKHAEDALRENRARLDLALKSARMGAWHWDIINSKRYFDDEVCRLLGIDPMAFTGSAEEFLDAVHPSDRDTVKESLARTLEKGTFYEADYRALWPDGSIHHIAARGLTVHDDKGRPIRLDGIVWDITSHKLAEEGVKASLKEKETLLKEIHHRVKNNLQVISSLLNMQSKYVREDVEAFRESMNRIKSMALIHDKLYRSENLSHIYFADYVTDLARELSSAYATERGVELDLHVDPVSFDIDTAIPLGLIVSELVSNSLKHAFSDGLGAKISIYLEQLGGQVTLVISDNGIGFPECLDFRDAPSLGMQLVVTLVEQLEGAIELRRDKGTEFKITFKESSSE